MVLRFLFLSILFGCVSCSTDSSDATKELSLEENKPFTEEDAKNLYSLRCVSCHGEDGKLGMSGAKDLSVSKLTDDEIVEIIQAGKNAMPSFNSTIPEEQQKMLVPIVKSLRK
jgi:mono/diheme cytochrome c family protein